MEDELNKEELPPITKNFPISNEHHAILMDETATRCEQWINQNSFNHFSISCYLYHMAKFGYMIAVKNLLEHNHRGDAAEIMERFDLDYTSFNSIRDYEDCVKMVSSLVADYQK